MAVHFDFVQPVFSSETPPWQTKMPLLKKEPTRLILNYTTKHLPVNSDILTYILGKKVLAKVKGMAKKDKITYLSFFFIIVHISFIAL